ncbi:GNAT family protein [Ruegeria sp.]|uniref:GNAT family N-acetyltransferase n=1 Tax=Ruegeria sp. TaxID=1879320 RepID=UPI002315BB49|nr:GNAT family protein [Ruegeria sp.]MDA7965394.1 GNAT family N-acetyltransferase [Ruegeria sp.]
MRPLEKGDLATIQRWFQDVEDLALFDRTCRIPMNQAQTEHIWEDALNETGDGKRCWFIIETRDDEAQGLIGIEAISTINRDGVVALFIDKALRGSGAGIRASALMLDFAFRQLGLNRITSYCRTDNQRSRDVLRALSFQEEGTMRRAWFSDGQFHDVLVVGLLQQEWATRRPSLARELGPETVVCFGPDCSTGWIWPPRE